MCTLGLWGLNGLWPAWVLFPHNLGQWPFKDNNNCNNANANTCWVLSLNASPTLSVVGYVQQDVQTEIMFLQIKYKAPNSGKFSSKY